MPDLEIGKVKKKTEPIQPTDVLTPKPNDLPVGDKGKLILSHISPLTVQPLQYTEGLDTLDEVAPGTPVIKGVPITDLKIANAQSGWDLIKNTGTQLGANLVSGVGQSLANMFDLVAGYKTAKGEIKGLTRALTGSKTEIGEDDFNSHFFGLSTKDMSDWAQNVAKNNPIYQKDPEALDYTDPAKWAMQISQLGTSLGMAGGTLAATAAIEALTGGVGTAGVMSKLGQLGRNLFSGAKAAEVIGEGYNIAKGLKSAAITYGVLNRYAESRMEAQQTYQGIYDKFNEKNPDGSFKLKKADGTNYTEKEKRELASIGARKDFNMNELLTPLDILAFRMMVFNPISGKATGGLIEPFLEKVGEMYGKSTAGKVLGFGTAKILGAIPEGIEEQSQQFFQDEGEHKARVLGGLDDKSTFFERFGKSVSANSSIDQGIGGFLGGLVLGPLMDATGRIIKGNQQAKNDAIYKHYLENVLTMDNATMARIKDLEAKGDFQSAEIGRRNYNIFKALQNKHIDEQHGKTTATDNYLSFLEDTLDQARNGKFDALQDLGFGEINDQTKQHVLDNFGNYIDDVKQVNDIYDQVKNHYNKNFVPSITWDRFQLQNASKEQINLNNNVVNLANNIFQYNDLSSNGKEQHDIGYKLNALQYEVGRLTKLHKDTRNSQEKENIANLLETTKQKITELNNRLDEIGNDESYTTEDKNRDNDIIKGSVHNQQYLQAIYDQLHGANNIELKRKKVALWNNKEYQQEQVKQSIKNSPNRETLKQNEADLEAKGENTEEIKEAIKEKERELNAREVADDIDGKQAEIRNGQEQPKIEEPKEKTFEEEVNELNNSELANFGYDVDKQNVYKEAYRKLEEKYAKKQPITIGNDDLFGQGLEGVSIIHGGSAVTSTALNEYEDAEADMLQSPSTIDMKKMSEEDKAKLKASVGLMLEQLPADIYFEDLIRTAISKYSKEKIDSVYNTLAEGWKLNDRKLTKEQQDAAYNKLFADPLEAIEDITKRNESIEKQEEQEVVKQLEETEKELETKENGQVEIDANSNQVVYVYDGKVTDNEKPKLPIVIRNIKTITTKNEDGTVTITHENTDDELRQDQHVNNLPLLDVNRFNVGDELVIRVPENVDDILVPVFNADGTKGEPITWKKWKEEHPDSPPDKQAYKDKIPLIAYDPKAKKGDKGLAFIHDIGWYTPNNFLQSEPEKMDQAIENTRRIREAVLAKAVGEDTAITITEKKTTTFAPFKTENKGTKANPDYEFIPLSEANPDSVIVVANGIDTFYEHGDFKFDNNENILLRTADLEDGKVYEIRRAGWKEGKKSWNVLPLAPQPLSTEARTTVIQALNVFVNRNNPNQAVRDKGKEIAKKIQEATGLDILRAGDLREYLSQFTLIHGDSNKAFGSVNNNRDVDAIANEKIKSKNGSSGYIVIQNGGTIYLGATKLNIIPNYQTVYVNTNQFNANTVSQFFNNLNKKYITKTNKSQISILDDLRQNYSFQAVRSNKPVVMIDADGNVKQVAASYKEYSMQSFKTNIRSINVAPEGEKPFYATTLQMISYDLSDNVKKEAVTPTVEDVTTPVVTETEVKQEEKGESIDQQIETRIQEVLAQAQKDLGIDFNNIEDEENLMSVAARTAEERKQFNNLNLRVSGLDFYEDAQLNDFIYNQIGIIVEQNIRNGKSEISDKEIQDTIKKIVTETLKPIRDYYKERVDIGESIIRDHPTTDTSGLQLANKKYKAEIVKIDQLTTPENLKILFDKGKARITDNLGIKETTAQDEYEEQTREEKEGWQIESALTVDPNAKTSAALKRFYSSIPILDKDGNPKKGVFQLPLYYSLDEVGGKIKGLLADTVSDYDTMIARLQQFKHAWIPQLIEKLNKADQQTKNQFVSDMSYNSLRMGYSMLQFNSKTKTWKAKNWDALQTGIANQIHNDWSNGFDVSNLILKDTDDEGSLMLNKEWATINVLNVYNNWLGENVPVLESEFTDKDKLSPNKTITITPPRDSKLGKELATKLPSQNLRLKYSPNSSNTYQIKSIGNGKYEVSKFESRNPSKQEVSKWLGNFGISLSSGALDELFERGLYHNYKQYKFDQLFNEGGLFRVLANSLSYAVNREGKYSYGENGKKPIDESVVKSLALLESKYDTNRVPTGVYIGGKSIYPITQEKFAVRRFLDLVSKDSDLRKQLSNISFSKGSMILNLLNDTGEIGEKFREVFKIEHIAPGNALQIMGKNTQEDNSLNSLSSLDYEMADFALFQDMQQGNISQKYAGTDIGMRIATMLMPTMSDKTTPLKVRTAVLNITNKEIDDTGNINNQVKQVLYEQVVRPELERMIKYWQNFHSNGHGTNVKAYDKGAALFMFIPKLNDVMYNDTMTLREVIDTKELSFRLDLETIEAQTKDKIFEVISDTIRDLHKEKLASWKKDGIVTVNENKEITAANWMDEKYINGDKFEGNIDQKVNMAILDKVVNDMIHLSNSFMLFAGDPAQYYKSSAKSIRAQVEESFTNVGKRLANQIAPGIKLANSENEKYLQVFLEDRKSIGDKNFIRNVTTILDGHTISDEDYNFIQKYLGTSKSKVTPEEIERFQNLQNKYPNSSGYFEIEGSDAQEYTTWQEHLHVLEQLGRTPDAIMDITIQDIAEARKLFSSNKKKGDLTEREKALIGLVMQPIKPVYTGQIYDKQQDLMRTVYIKTSSFPLIPQMTEGFELDHLRIALEKLSKNQNLHVRASYQSGNKVGAMNNPVNLWDEEGRAITDNISTNNLLSSSLVLNRKDFKIQQDVPFKSGKNKEDKQTYGTQLMKLLFGNGIINFEGFKYQGETLKGTELHKKYTDLHIDLVNLKQQQFFKELGLDKAGNIVDRETTINAIQKLLKDEGEKRGFPKQVLESLELTPDGNKEFVMPLWASISSDKFESLLNSIVANRTAKLKFPGNAYVAGSPEGFKTIKKENQLEPSTQSQVVYTSSWDGDSLKASYKADGTIRKVQVFVSSKFRDNKGNLINLLDDEWSEIVNGQRRIRQDKFDEKLFSLTSFRIPTTGISSASQIEIVGFLPHANADLMILPSNLTKQKGLDFDIDKENTYQYWHHINSEGKFEVFNESHIADLVEKRRQSIESGNENVDKFIDAFFPEVANENAEDLESYEQKLKEKVIQNNIISIYESVLTNPDNDLQAKINGVLSTDYSEAEAAFIESLNPDKVDNWTPLSSNYQKSKVAIGSSGKIGTGAYSMDVVFHSLAQQAAVTGKPIQLLGLTGNPVNWRFGSEEDGGVETDGRLGNIRTRDEDRTTSDLLNEVAQTAVDNEKLQIMGRVNVNDITLDVHKVFNLLGIDKFNTESKHSVAYLFLSQPILRDYVQLIGNSQSILAEYKPNQKEKIVTSLLVKYGANLDNLGEAQNEDLLSEEELIQGIKSKGRRKQVQVATLLRFLEMEQFGLAIRGVQTTLNVDSKGLGKSFFDVIQKRAKLDNLGNDIEVENGGQLTNIKGLVGTYIDAENANEAKMLEDGYYNMGKYFVKPTTYVGAFNIATVATAYNTWHNFMPYDSPVLKAIFDELLPIIQTSDSDNKTIENKQAILADLKKYFTTLSAAGFIGKNDDINEERRRLYIDSDTNISLPTYIRELLKTNGNTIIDKYIKTNKLINSLEIVPSKNGQPSLMKFNNSNKETWNEEYLYQSLTTLMEVRGKQGTLSLPKIGNKEYTLDTLAQDIINYAMLGNAKQEAIQFSKYVPVAYMNMIGYSYMMRNFHGKLSGTADIDAIKKFAQRLGLTGKTEKTKHLISEFSTQFIQHNPQLVKVSLDANELSSKLPQIGDNQYIYTSDDKPTFIKVYDSIIKDKKKFRLFKFNGTTYNQIPLLGVFGMDEYQFNKGVGISIVNGQAKKIQEPEPIVEGGNNTENNLYSINTTDSVKQVVSEIAKDTTNPFHLLAGKLLEHIGDTKFVLKDTIQVNGQPYTNFNGGYNPKTGIITINPTILSNPQLVAQTLLHEITHSITYDKVNPFIIRNDNGTVSIKENAPKYVQDLVSVFNHSISQAKKEEIDNFIKNMANVTNEEKSKYYGYTNIHEFMTMALTDKGFQDILNKIEYKRSGQTLLDKFKDVVKQILESIGVKFDENYTAAHAISAIFEVIKADEKEAANPYQKMVDEASKLGKGTVVRVVSGVDMVRQLAGLGEGIDVLRKTDTNHHYGNPFTPLPLANTTAKVKVNTTAEAVQAFKDWIYGNKYQDIEPQRRQWIVDQINSGALDGKVLLYYKKLNEPSHADALAEIVNNRLTDQEIKDNTITTLDIMTSEFPDIKFEIPNTECV